MVEITDLDNLRKFVRPIRPAKGNLEGDEAVWLVRKGF